MPVTATAYTYDELSDDAKKTAIEKCRDWHVDGTSWWEYVYEWYKDEILPEQGFEVKETRNGDAMYFSGFWSQGDGASFAAGVNVRQFLKANKLSNEFRSLYYWSDPDFGYAYANISQNGHHYSHEMTMNIETEWTGDWHEDADNSPAVNQLDELESIILEKARELARKLYRHLEEEYESLTSDESLDEYFTDCDHIHFWSNGHPAHFA